MTISTYIRLTRPRTLVAAVAPIALGASFAYAHYTPFPSTRVASLYVLLALSVVLIAQIAVNIWNEYFDYASGLDEEQVIGNSGAITRDGISPQKIYRLAVIASLLALILGFILALTVSLALIPMGLICIGIGFFYSGGPYPISRTPYGELASGFAMGFAIVLIAAFTWSHKLTFPMLIPSIPSFFMVAAIMLTNNIRDMINDKKHGRRTLPICIGREKSLLLLKTAFTFVGVWTLLFVFLDYLPLLSLPALTYLFPAQKSVHILTVYSDVRSLDKALGMCALANLLYSFGIAFGLFSTGGM